MFLPTVAQRGAGFTLLEILVALAVLALALAALLNSTGQTLENTAYLRDKTLAHWVGMNVLAEIRVRGEWPEAGKRNGSEHMAGREWFWQLEVKTTADPDLRRLEIRVAAKQEAAALALLTGFAGLKPTSLNPRMDTDKHR